MIEIVTSKYGSSAVTETLEIVVVSTGEQGAAGRKGDDGRSAYEVWLSLGNVGTEADYINSLVGATGKSAYQEWLDLGNVGTESDFIAALSQANPAQSSVSIDTLIAIAAANINTNTRFINSLE